MMEPHDRDPDTREYYFGGTYVPPAAPQVTPQVAASPAPTPEPVRLLDPAPHKAFFSRLGMAVLALTLGYQVGATVLATLVTLPAPGITATWWYRWLLTEVSLYGIGLPCMLIVLRRLPPAPFNATWRTRSGGLAQKPRFGVGVWLVVAVIAAGLMQIGGLIGNGLMSALSGLTGYDYANSLDGMVDQSPLWVTFLGTVVIAPIGEELMFRKLLIDRTRRWGDGLSILLSGLLFGLFHGNLFQLFYAAMLGCVLAYVYTRTGRLAPCVGLHALVNFLGGILPTLLQRWIGPENLSDPELLTEHLLQHPAQYLVYMLYSAWILGAMLASVILLICLRRRVKLGDGEVILPRRQRLAIVLLNAGMLVCLVALVTLILSNLLLPLLVG